MSISVMRGRPGQGKTVLAVGEIVRLLGAGYFVLSNIDVKLPAGDKRARDFKRMGSLDEIKQLNVKQLFGMQNWKGKPYKGIKIVLDEVQVYLNSRKWDSLDEEVQLLLQQHRKRGMDIIGFTQSVKRADVVFRELVQYFYGVRKIFVLSLFGYTFGLFIVSQYDPDDIESPGRDYTRVAWPSPFFVDPFTFSIYDTTQELQLDRKVGRRVVETYEIKPVTTEQRVLISKQIVVQSEGLDTQLT